MQQQQEEAKEKTRRDSWNLPFGHDTDGRESYFSKHNKNPSGRRMFYYFVCIYLELIIYQVCISGSVVQVGRSDGQIGSREHGSSWSKGGSGGKRKNIPVQLLLTLRAEKLQFINRVIII